MRPLLRNVLGPGIVKQFELDHEMMPVMADPTQLEVAVLNLAINARDAMPDGGLLRFTSKAVQVDHDPELEPGTYIELCISDTGVGMPGEIAARAFEPFFTTKEIGKGTGLGLSMVYGMARQSGGTARIESTPGAGTAVKLYFRQADAGSVVDPAASAADAADVEEERRPASVLVIDDDPDVRAFIVATLEEQGYRGREAPDGEQGLAALRPQKAGPRHSRLHHAGPVRRRSRQPDPRRRAAAAHPVRLRLQRDGCGQARRAGLTASHQAVPRRSTCKRRSGERSAPLA